MLFTCYGKLIAISMVSFVKLYKANGILFTSVLISTFFYIMKNWQFCFPVIIKKSKNYQVWITICWLDPYKYMRLWKQIQLKTRGFQESELLTWLHFAINLTKSCPTILTQEFFGRTYHKIFSTIESFF